ncbi:hypothetical protein [Ornithinimicrobium cerasi]|uniref:Uncharacterized protein n=1 Tax=Ornithinimicrobium cerasi TaxID=2248773 RepID=A0A285VRS5_9MICO|nr:hypothetical protein [Ornithinimicrobium cerasi]SOC56587.1 hypothetical protein SAMN05421879_10846 [Ornithinimicrobium cerasi]
MSTPVVTPVVAPVVPLHVLGTDVDIRVGGDDPDPLASTLRTRWHLCLRDTDAPAAEEPPAVVEAALRRTDDPDRPGPTPPARFSTVVTDADERRLLQRVTQAVTYAAIGARSGELLMLHAAALAHPGTGATAAFVAPGNTGKTTLCRTHGPGRAYVTDETVGVRRDGTVTPYPKPLSTRRADWLGVKDEQAPGDLGLRGPGVQPWLAGIVLLRRDGTRTGPAEVEELDLLDAVLAITPESSAFMTTEAPLQWLSDVLGRTGGALRVTYSEVSELADLVEEICGRASPW